MTLRRGSLVFETGLYGWGRAPGVLRLGRLRVSWAPGSILDEMDRLMAALREARDRLRGPR